MFWSKARLSTIRTAGSVIPSSSRSLGRNAWIFSANFHGSFTKGTKAAPSSSRRMSGQAPALAIYRLGLREGNFLGRLFGGIAASKSEQAKNHC